MMQSSILRILILMFILLPANAAPILAQDQPIKVVTTIGQLTDIVKNIGGDRVAVQGLMGAGVDPHLYKASESDVRKLSNAQIIFYNGLFLEAKMEDIFKKMGSRIKTVAISSHIPRDQLLDSLNYSGHYDPHIWFDVTFWMKAVEKVRATLIEFDPAHKDDYTARAEAYLKELIALDETVQSRANELPKDQRVLVTAHDAFRYFGRKYGFEVKGLQGVSTQSEAGVNDVHQLAEFIAKRKIKAIFVESSVPERNIKAVKEAVQSRGWDVKIGGELFSDAMGNDGTFEGTYIGMVTHNINTIIDSLK